MSRYSHARSSSQQEQLAESFIQDSFHSYLKSSLTQAKAERLLDVDVLASAEGDLMITGPALCLYFAALRCTTNPPSVPLPRSRKTPASQPQELSYDNCPSAFVSFLRVWANAVPTIQALSPESQHDLARIICGLLPLTNTSSDSDIAIINGIAADLRAVAIEISQRRSFQDRYAADLQAALDSGTDPTTPSPRKASFVPPPVYDASPSPQRPSFQSESRFSPPARASRPSLSRHHHTPSSSTSISSISSAAPSLFTQDSPAIEFIRETLYASLADTLEKQPSLRKLLRRDKPRAYFASVAFAILDVACTSVIPDSNGAVAVVGVLGNTLTIAECPRELRPLMQELGGIGTQAQEMEREDNELAIRLVEEGEDVPSLSRLDRVKLILEEGVGYEYDSRHGASASGQRNGNATTVGRGSSRPSVNTGRRSVEGRAVAFANRINALSLQMTRLKAFRERQDDVFKVLAGIGS